MRRFLVENVQPGPLVLPPRESRHAARVLRLREGDPVVVFDGRGHEGHATIAEASGARVVVQVREVHTAAREPGVDVTCATAIPKGSRESFLVEKLVELGIARLAPIRFERSVRTAAPDRVRRIVQAAAKQSGRMKLPPVEPERTLGEFVAAWGSAGPILWTRAQGGRPLRDALSGIAASTLAYVVGPEGGLTSGETALLERAEAVPVRVGRTVLRVETAAMAVLAGIVACRSE